MAALPATMPAMAPRLSLCTELDVDCCPPTELLLMGVVVAVSTQPMLPECERVCPDVAIEPPGERGGFDRIFVPGSLEEWLLG